MVRISDTRMSGTSFGTAVLHISPESAVGGPLAAVPNGDRISLDGPAENSNCCYPTKKSKADWNNVGKPRAAIGAATRCPWNTFSRNLTPDLRPSTPWVQVTLASWAGLTLNLFNRFIG